jgi:hypothetical protein
MKDYLKITDAILVDDVIFEEKSVALPELTPEMQVLWNSPCVSRFCHILFNENYIAFYPLVCGFLFNRIFFIFW